MRNIPTKRTKRLTFCIIRLRNHTYYTQSEKSRRLALAGAAKSGRFLRCGGEISPLTSSTPRFAMLISKLNPKPGARQLLPKKH